jgi:putative acetyltransferase
VEQFARFILAVTTFVAEDSSGIVGFAGIGDEGHITSVYVRHDALGQGIGTYLLQTLVNHAQETGLARLYAEASEFSLGLFESFGFRQVSTEVVERHGVEFQRYVMERINL